MGPDGIRFTRAIVRPPAENFADGLTRAELGRPSHALALEQHAAYCRALTACGLELLLLAPDARYPDSCFVEDTAVLLPEGAMLTRPGAESRLGEVDAVRAALAGVFPALACITAPGTVDGGDICEAGRVVFIGLSRRTNAEGAAQLAQWLRGMGYEPRLVSIHGIDTILHLKSGLSWLGDGRLLVIDALAGHPEFADFECVAVDPGELYAANAVRVNDRVLIAAGFARLEARLRALGYSPIALDMGEFEKMDGALTCLSLRF
ncbi:arginine deiminase family protein [soil metagenome]